MTFAQPFSDYEVLDRVGAGSMGTVFKARHKKLNRVVALKVLKPSLARDIRYVDRLRREARIVASLNHLNIVTGYDLGQEGGYHFFVMEFIEGKSLRELLHEWGMFAEDRVLDVAIQITTALDHAFGKGVIHRDIKPANILIDAANVVKLTDMGLAKGPDNLTITRDGATVGTPQYISPEQARSPQDVDVRSDLYSLGATLFHMCTGQPPFRAETMANVLIKVLEERAPSAAGINPDLSDGLNLIIRKLLSKDPGKRYQTPAALLTDLRRVQRSEAPDVDIDDLDSGHEDDGTRKKLLWSAAVATPILAVAGWFAFRDEPKPVAPGPDPRTVFREAVIQGLRTDHIIKVGDKLSRIGQLEIGNDTGFKKEVLASLRRGFEERLADDLPEIFRELHGEGFEGLDWSDPESALKRRLAGRIKNQFGIEDSQLPPGARTEYRRQWTRISQAMRGFTQKREQRFKASANIRSLAILEGLEDHLRALAVRPADEFLGNALRGFGEFDDAPAVSQLPAPLKMFVETKRKEVATVAGRKIDVVNRKLTEGFATAMKDLDALVERWLHSPATAIARLDEFVRHLQDDYPPRNFRRVDDPWKAARRRLKEIGDSVVTELASLAETSFARAIQTTYRVAVGGDLAAAKAELKLFADATHPRFAIHMRLLDHMANVRRLLLQAHAPASGVSRKPIRNVHTRDGAPTKVAAVRVGGRVVLQAGGVVVPLALLNVRDLVAAAPGFETRLRSGGERAGLAVWYVLSHQSDVDNSGIASLVDEAHGEVFRIDLVRRKLVTSLAKPPSLQAQQLLAAIKMALEGRRWDAARTSLDRLRENYPDFAKRRFLECKRYDQEITHGFAVAELEKRLIDRRRAVRMSKIGYKIAADFAVTVDFEVREEQLPIANRKGWVQDRGGAVRYEVEGETLAFARGHTLVLPSLLAADQPASTTTVVDVSFAAENGVPRLLFVSCHGATIGIGLQRDGVVAVFPVDKGLDPLPDLSRKIKKALQLASDRRVVPGARHRFYFVMRKKGGTNFAVAVRVFMDEEPSAVGLPATRKGLGEVVVQRSSNPSPSLRLTPLSPVVVYAVEFRGRG
jgi:serine/threonine protein kinase